MPTSYKPYKVNLSNGQKIKLAKAYKTSSPITIRLTKNELKGNDELLLTSSQIKRIIKAQSLGKGSDIKISKTQIRKVMRKGGSLFSAILPLVRTLGPTIGKVLGLSALSGLASEGASQVVKKISGKGQIGGFLIPQNKIDQLIQYKHLLTNKQKQDILNALEIKGGSVIIKPTQKQTGGFLGAVLASIGLPLAIEAIKKITGKGAPRIGAPAEGGSAPQMGIYTPPPFYGNWPDKTVGAGKKKGQGLLLGKNSPFNNIPILGTLL